MSLDISYVLNTLPKMVGCFFYTLWVILATAAISFALSVPITAIRIKKIPLISQLCEVWLSFIRSMPGIVELFLAYFVFPKLLEAIGISTADWPLTTYVLIAMVFHYAPYLSEVLRPAYLSVDRGQHEAAATIGMTKPQAFWRITAPQALPMALPQLGNSLIGIVLETSLLFTIGVVDLMGKANVLIVSNYGLHKLEVYIAVAICYWILTAMSVLGLRRCEKHFEKYKLSGGVKK